MLLVVDLVRNKSTLVDSCAKEINDQQYRSILKRCYKFIQLINRIGESQAIETKTHQYCLVQDAPQQPANTLDCGVYVLL